MPDQRILSRKPAFALLIFVLLVSLLQAIPAQAQQAPPVQEIMGKINPGGVDIFVLSDLKQGQTLFITLQTTSGNLDPVLSLVPASVDLPKLITTYRAEVQRLIQESDHPMAELPTLNDKTF